jgi:uncharacterized membrane protein
MTVPEKLPAWQRATEGEHRLAPSLAIGVAIGLQVFLDHDLVLGPVWLLPALELVLFCALIVGNPVRISREGTILRSLGIGFCALITVANSYSALLLIIGLLNGKFGDNATPLFATGSSIWITNIIVFALWYWELDRGGPAARANARTLKPDFMFVQMDKREFADPDWEPQFADYLYLSFTNAMAFSPTDVMPLSRWAKMLMLAQSVVSLATMALVIARVVNVFK